MSGQYSVFLPVVATGNAPVIVEIPAHLELIVTDCHTPGVVVVSAPPGTVVARQKKDK